MTNPTDVMWHLSESIEPWVDKPNGEYWSVDRVMEDNTLLFTIRDYDTDMVKEEFYVQVTAK